MVSEFNQRQLDIMVQSIDGFSDNTVSLNRLANNLEGLLQILEGVASHWKQDFLHEWGKIEDARADLAYRSIREADPDTRERVIKAGENIKRLILRFP